MKLATLTLEAIDAAITADGGARFRGLQKKAFAELTDAFSTKVEDGFRTHLGASVVGRPCARDLWYSFHWAKKPEHPSQLLRLFNRGHLEEARFVAMLRLIGCQLWATGEDGKQLRIHGCSGHFGGSLDGVVLGLPDAPEVPHLAEFKTHGNKSFSSLVSEGVMRAKWEHYVQMQLYMHANSLTAALYLAVNKDNDALHAELVEYDATTAERYLQRAQSIIDSPEPPSRINNSAAWFQCKFCQHAKMCHDFEFPEVNCRTCAHSTPVTDAKWLCEHTNKKIPKDCRACEKHIYNPTMLNGITILNADLKANWMHYRLADGTEIDLRTK